MNCPLKGLFGSIEKKGRKGEVRGGIYNVDKITLIFLLKFKIILVGILKFYVLFFFYNKKI
jgi:hypothetical protein